jgi:hypothetical protein
LNRILRIDSCLECKYITGGSYCVKTGAAVDGPIPEDCPLPKVKPYIGKKAMAEIAPGDEILRNHNYYGDMLEIARKHDFPALIPALKTLYDKYYSCPKVAAILKVNERTVRDMLKEIGHPLRQRGHNV